MAMPDIARAPESVFFPSFFFNDTATTAIYTLSLHDALPIFHVTRPRVAATAGVVCTGEVGWGRRHERSARALPVARDAVAADAALQEDFLAPQEVCFGHRQRIPGEPVAPIDLGEVGSLLELVLGWVEDLVVPLEDGLVCALEAGVGLCEPLIGGDDVLRVQLAG